MLYARGRTRIEIEDVEAIVANAAPSALDELVDQALIGDLKRAAATATRYFSEGGDGDLMMIRLVQRLTLIHRLRLEMDQGRSFDAACQALFVRLPPSAMRMLAVQAERWTSDSLARRLPLIRAASARVRAEPRLAEILATRAIWSLASRSGAGEGSGASRWTPASHQPSPDEGGGAGRSRETLPLSGELARSAG